MVTIRGVIRSFDGKPVLRGVDLDIAQGEIVCLLGPSGCGKTTLLRIIAGLELADSGDVQIDGHSIKDLPVHRRDFGLMFQDFALFPHMNVEKNVAFGLKMRHARDIPRRVNEVLELVGLSSFERRDVTRLSGGERQRVALARSLAPNPRLLMLDEPLGSLDASLRERLAIELRTIIKRVSLTAIYVTHDQQEAFAIADRIAVMNAGVIEQVAAPESVYRQPGTDFVARFLGLNNIVPVIRRDANSVHTVVGDFPVDGDLILLHPLGIQITDADTPDAIRGRVTASVFAGEQYRLEIRHSEAIQLAFSVPARDSNIPRVGEVIHVRVMPEMVVPLVASKT